MLSCIRLVALNFQTRVDGDMQRIPILESQVAGLVRGWRMNSSESVFDFPSGEMKGWAVFSRDS